ncbi:11712_t:CDS:2 [Paraglomus brasilianum]|uniref:11712_t:CDS:1 n=1 Tax=Paraglomus brasilianum TaxID=144538 RepID=A0A9N8ZNE7_9GLOM|nr:11712_t:CDS:2 [Paraglomus brasilianum]
MSMSTNVHYQVNDGRAVSRVELSKGNGLIDLRDSIKEKELLNVASSTLKLFVTPGNTGRFELDGPLFQKYNKKFEDLIQNVPINKDNPIIVELPEGEPSTKRQKRALSEILSELGFEHVYTRNRIDLNKLSCEELVRFITKLGQPLMDQDLFGVVFDTASSIKDKKVPVPKSNGIITSNEPLSLPVVYMHQLFVRPDYVNLYNIIVKKGGRIHLTGTSGIGKSCFLVYFVIRLLSESRDEAPNVIVFQTKDPLQKWYCFMGTSALRCGSYQDFYSVLTFKNAWYLADDIVDPRVLNVNTLVTLSLNSLYEYGNKQFQEYAKNCMTYYMPPWSINELTSCQQQIFPNLPPALMSKLFLKAGGIPRYILQQGQIQWDDPANNQNYDLVEKKALRRFFLAFTELGNTVKLLECFRDGGHYMKYSSRLIHTWNSDDSYTDCYFKFASRYVFDKIQDCFTEETARYMLRQLADHTFYGTNYRGKMFELYVLYLWRSGGSRYTTKKLGVANSSSGELCTQRNPSIHRVQNVDTFKIPDRSKNELFIPLHCNFPTADFIVSPDKIFQITITTDHGVNMNGLVKIMNEMRRANPGTDKIKIFFVVPEDIYNNFKFQNYMTAKNQKAQHLAYETKYVEQWALKIDIASAQRL